MKDVGTLLPFIRENSQDFQSWNCSGTVCNEWNKYTFRKDLQIQEQGRKTGTQVPAQAHVGGLVEKLHAQTWKTNTYLGAIPPGKGKPEEHFTIQFTQTFTHPCNSALAGFAQGMFPSESPALMCSNTQQLMGEFMAESSHFPSLLQATQLTLDKRSSFLSQLQLPIIGSSVLCYICSSFPIQLHTKPATSEEDSLTQ